MRYRLLAITSISAMMLAMPAAAEMFYDQAAVLDTQPIYEARQVPVRTEQCGYEPSTTQRPVDRTMLGDARVRDPGADLLGALTRDIELREPAADVYACRMVTRMESKTELAGYRVRYEYDGRVHERRVAEPPGETIRVGVQVSVGQSGIAAAALNRWQTGRTRRPSYPSPDCNTAPPRHRPVVPPGAATHCLPLPSASTADSG